MSVPLWRGHVKDKRLVLAQTEDFRNIYVPSLEGRAVELALRERPRIRSVPANRYYWGCVVEDLARYTGHTRMEIHEIMKALFLGEGDEIAVAPSTAGMSDEDFWEYIENCKTMALRIGIRIPEPSEADFGEMFPKQKRPDRRYR